MVSSFRNSLTCLQIEICFLNVVQTRWKIINAQYSFAEIRYTEVDTFTQHTTPIWNEWTVVSVDGLNVKWYTIRRDHRWKHTTRWEISKLCVQNVRLCVWVCVYDEDILLDTTIAVSVWTFELIQRGYFSKPRMLSLNKDFSLRICSTQSTLFMLVYFISMGMPMYRIYSCHIRFKCLRFIFPNGQLRAVFSACRWSDFEFEH